MDHHVHAASPQNKAKVQEQFREVALKDLLSNQSGLAPYNSINDFGYLFHFSPMIS